MTKERCLDTAGHPEIIHCDIKAANILLDFKFEAEVNTLYLLVIGIVLLLFVPFHGQQT